jgi:hypothetical protein
MPVIHGRNPANFPAMLDRYCAQFRDDELKYDMAEDGTWRIEVSSAGWFRVMEGEPEIRKAASLLGDLHAPA